MVSLRTIIPISSFPPFAQNIQWLLCVVKLLLLWINELLKILSLAAQLSSWKLEAMASFIESIHGTLDLPFFLLPPTFLSIVVISRESWILVITYQIRDDLIPAILPCSECRGLFWSRINFVSLSDPRYHICETLLQNHILNDFF